MPLRLDPITRLPLIEAGTTCSPEQVPELEARLLTDLQDDIPALRHLRASALTTRYEVDPRGLWLLVLLAEQPQLSLPLPDGHGRRSARTADPYADDFRDIREQMAQAEGRILIAVSGAASPLDGTIDTATASSTGTIRRRVRRGMKGGSVLVPGIPDASRLLLEDLPTTLPQGPLLTITARVKSLERECAQLVGVQVKEPKAFRRAIKISPSKQVRMERVGRFQRVDAGTQLQTAMDTRSELRLRVVAALSWDSGDVVSLELKDLLK